ncbi:sensor histidine kinase [Spirosoma arboris]|nr:histidine kinase [Spirosoma arboris]
MNRLLARFIGLVTLLLTGDPMPSEVWAQVVVPDQSLAGRIVPANKLSANNLDLRPFATIWIDTASIARYPTITQLAQLSPFPTGTLKAYGKKPTIWLRFRIQNPHPTDTLHRLFFGGYHHSWGISQFDAQNRLVVAQENGLLFRQSAEGSADPFTLPLLVPPNQTRTIWFQTTGYSLFSSITPRLFTRIGYEQFRNSRLMTQRNHFGYCCSIIGICLFLSIFAGIQGTYSRDVTYGYWSLYLAVTGFFFVLLLDLGFNLQVVGPTVAALYEPMKYLIELTYLLFLLSFLKLNQYTPRLNRLILVMVWCLPIVFGLNFWGILTHTIPVINFFSIVFILSQILILFIFVVISRAKVPNRHLVITGSLGLIVMAGVATGLNKAELTDFDYFWTDPSVWFSLGVVFELIFFNLALSQRGRLAERAKQRLEHEKALENQRIHLITEQFQQRIAETEMAALRSQMNPHFIFNCLNSIQFFTAQNDSEKASDYLTKFSRLIRLVLENSKSEKVTLANELETLRLYIEMEAMRFGQKVQYSILVNDQIDTELIQIPPLLLQPFVENAIWHGLMHKSEGGTIQIHVEQPQPSLLHIEISDDGVGRKQAAEYKSKSATKNKSFGMKLTADRIELINQLYQTQTQVDILDLMDQQGDPSGTKIIVDIPI